MVKALVARVTALEREVKELRDLKRLVLSKGRVGGKTEFIVEWLNEIIQEEGEVTVQEAKTWANENGISWVLMNRAKHKAGLFSVRQGKYSVWRNG
jgi:hypothetical protein